MRKDLNILMLISLLIIVLYNIISINKALHPSPIIINITSKAPSLLSLIFSSVLDLIYRLGLAYITSYIFYFVVVHIKNQRDRGAIYPHIIEQSNVIIGRGKLVLGEMRRTTGSTMDSSYPTMDEVEFMCKSIHPYQLANMQFLGGSNASWLQYLEHFMDESKIYLKDIYSLIQFLDAEYIKLLTSFERNQLYIQMTLIRGVKINNADISVYAKPMFEYYQKLEAIDLYCQTKYDIYVK